MSYQNYDCDKFDSSQIFFSFVAQLIYLRKRKYFTVYVLSFESEQFTFHNRAGIMYFILL